MSKEEMLKELKTRPYDFICNNYYKMEKEELKDIIVELLALFDGEEYNQLKTDLVENLIEIRDWA